MLLDIKNLTKKYELPSGSGTLSVLNNISLSIPEGKTLAVVGPSGSGKSTFLNIIGSLDKPTSGTIMFSGQDIALMNNTELSKFRNRDIGFIFQLHHLLPQCTALENVLIPTIPFSKKHNHEEILNRAENLLDRVSLGKHRDFFPSQLSGGEMQRVAVIRSLINQPKLILADEPTGSLDKESSDNLIQILLRLNKEEKTTLIVVTHSNELADLMDNIYSLQNGALNKIK